MNIKQTALPVWLNSIKEICINGNDAYALRELDKYLEKYPQDDYGKFLKAKILLRNGYKNESENILKLLVYSNKVGIPAKVKLSKLYEEKNKLKEAAKLLDEVIAQSPYEEEMAKYNYVFIKCKQKDFNGALKILSTLSNKYTDKYKITLAKVYAMKKDKNKSLKTVENVNIENLNDGYKYNLINLYLLNGEYDKVLELSDKVIDKIVNKKFYYKILLSEFIAYDKKEIYDPIISRGEEIIKSGIGNDLKQIQLLLGDAYKSKAHYIQSKENYKEALKSNDKRIKQNALLNLGILEQEVGNFDEAEINYKTYLKIHKHNPKVYFMLISLAFKKRNYLEGEKYFIDLNKNCKDYDISDYQLVELILNKNLYPSKLPKYNWNIKSQVLENLKEKSEDKIEKKLFNKSIDIVNLYNESQEKLTLDNICYRGILDTYEIDYENIACGIHKYRVLAIPETTDIVAMFPKEDEKMNRLRDYETIMTKEKENLEYRRQMRYTKFIAK